MNAKEKEFFDALWNEEEKTYQKIAKEIQRLRSMGAPLYMQLKAEKKLAVCQGRIDLFRVLDNSKY